jgi:hypothetical protein
MTQENEAKLIDTIKQIISKVNALTDEVNQLKANQKQQLHKRYVEPMDIGLDYTGSRTNSKPTEDKQETQGTYPPVDTAPEWKVTFTSSTVKPNGEDGLIQMDFSQQAFSEKQAIYLCRKDSYWPTMNQLVKIKEFKSYKEVSVTAQKY